MAKQSEQLTAFYRAYKSWVEAGAPVENEHGFSRGIGLCTNSLRFTPCCVDEMIDQFIEAGLDKGYPFHDGDNGLYFDEGISHKCHLNKKRLEWVYNHCENV